MRKEKAMSQEYSKAEIGILYFFSGIGIALILGSLILYSLGYLGYWQKESLFYADLSVRFGLLALFLVVAIHFISNRLRRQA